MYLSPTQMHSWYIQACDDASVSFPTGRVRLVDTHALFRYLRVPSLNDPLIHVIETYPVQVSNPLILGAVRVSTLELECGVVSFAFSYLAQIPAKLITNQMISQILAALFTYSERRIYYINQKITYVSEQMNQLDLGALVPWLITLQTCHNNTVNAEIEKLLQRIKCLLTKNPEHAVILVKLIPIFQAAGSLEVRRQIPELISQIPINTVPSHEIMQLMSLIS